MSNRCSDWFRQAEADLYYSCFAAHQATEKALKAVFLKQCKDAWGHTLTVLIGNLYKSIEEPSEALVDYAWILDKFYIPTRYPNGFDSVAPTNFYTTDEAQSTSYQAEAILEFCRHQID